MGVILDGSSLRFAPWVDPDLTGRLLLSNLSLRIFARTSNVVFEGGRLEMSKAEVTVGDETIEASCDSTTADYA